jgi:5-methylcytosine-specific restriction endonuclease McrA
MQTCTRCSRTLPITEFHKRTDRKKSIQSACRDCTNRATAVWRLKVRKETVAAYGGQCQCCGETELDFLSIDHINGGGTRERRGTKLGGVNFYSQLRKQGWPSDYRILCHNCNQAMWFHGSCPHGRLTNHSGLPLTI